jgi:hypothetical protein
MSPEELGQVVRRCEDTAQLEAYISWAKANNPIVKDLATLKATRGWSHQHFLAIAVVALCGAASSEPEGKN